MNNLDYSEIKLLLEKYRNKFYDSLNPLEQDLLDELINKLSYLDEISKEIVDLVSHLPPLQNLEPDESDIIIFMGMPLQLKRADPNVPIKLDNATTALPPIISGGIYGQNTAKIEKSLKRKASEFYMIADRITHITDNLPRLSSFKCKQMRIIRNQLLEHPEGENSLITYDSFSYSKNEGPYIKGLRKGKQVQHMDQGFKNNSEEFISSFKKVLLQALN